MAGLIEQLKRAAKLPSPPGTALQILRLAQQEDVSVSEVAEALSSDPALLVRILKYANSALLGMPREITTVREAVVLLGMRSVLMMALSFSLVSARDRRACPEFDFSCFWSRSLAHGVAARHLAGMGSEVFPEEAFTAGLLASIGKLVFAVALPVEYAEILRRAGGLTSDTALLEQQRFGMNYIRAGAELIGEWGIPGRLSNAVRYQANPKDAVPSSDSMKLATVVCEARPYVDLICGPRPAEDPEAQTAAWEALSDIPELRRLEILKAMQEEYRELAGILSLRYASEREIDHIQTTAGEVLNQLSLAAQLRNDAVEREKKDLQDQAWRDGLTGLATRGAFDHELENRWREAMNTRRPLGLVLLDIDHFKKFNERFGHRTGDTVLRDIAKCITPVCRSVDFVARYAGEEFAIILPNADRLIAASICVSIRRAVEERLAHFQEVGQPVTISLGAVLLPQPSPQHTPAMLLEAAQQQLYRSKDKGCNCCSMIQLSVQLSEDLVPES
jgi:diguanylate cyclase (GGDEF)-like protein